MASRKDAVAADQRAADGGVLEGQPPLVLGGGQVLHGQHVVGDVAGAEVGVGRSGCRGEQLAGDVEPHGGPVDAAEPDRAAQAALAAEPVTEGAQHGQVLVGRAAADAVAAQRVEVPAEQGLDRRAGAEHLTVERHRDDEVGVGVRHVTDSASRLVRGRLRHVRVPPPGSH